MSDQTASKTKFNHEGTLYDVTAVPAANSKVVSTMKAEVLGGVRLDKLAHDLAITGDLIYLAYCATPPKHGDLRSQIDALHIEFGDIAGECVLELGNIRAASQEVTRKLGSAFGMLYKGREDVAITYLAQCAADAAKLAEAAGKLADKFEKLCTAADKALSNSQVIQGTEITARDGLIQQKNRLLEKQGHLITLQERLADLVGSLKFEYNEAKGELRTTEQRAFALSITGAIMQPLGQALSGAGTAVAMVYGARANPLGALGGGANGGSSPATTTPATQPQRRAPSADDQSQLDDAQAKFNKAKLDFDALEWDERTLEATIDVCNKSLDAIPTCVRDPAERRDVQTALSSEIGRAQRALDTAKSERDLARTTVNSRRDDLEAVKTLLEKAGVAISDAGKNLSSVGNDYMRIAESQRDTVKELFKTLVDKQDEERKILGQVREAALRLENISLQVDSAEVTISALFQVIAALKQVVAILHEARLFWRNMEAACKALASPSFKNEIKDYMKEFPTDDRVDLFYNTDGFKLTILNYLAKWRALELIADEYLGETKDTRVKVVHDFRTFLVGDKVKAKVKELSAKLIGEVAKDLEKLDAETAIVEEAQSRLAA